MPKYLNIITQYISSVLVREYVYLYDMFTTHKKIP